MSATEEIKLYRFGTGWVNDDRILNSLIKKKEKKRNRKRKENPQWHSKVNHLESNTVKQSAVWNWSDLFMTQSLKVLVGFWIVSLLISQISNNILFLAKVPLKKKKRGKKVNFTMH